MREWNEDYEEDFEPLKEFDENPETDWEKEILFDRIENIDAYDEMWAEDLRNIEDPELQLKELEAAEKIIEKRNTLEKRFEAGEINQDQFNAEVDFGLRKEESRAHTRAGMATQGLTYDHIGDLTEDQSLIYAGDIETLDQKDELKKDLSLIEKEVAQEMIDRELEEGRIDKKGHESLSRLARLYGK